MQSWIAISRNEHANSHWRPRHGFEFAAEQQVIPVVIAELAKLIPHYPLGFVKTENDTYQAGALVGLGGKRNLYITQDSKWLCRYVPALLRAYPFALHKDAKNEDASDTTILCIDEAYVSDDEALPRLFNKDGELAEGAAEKLNFLSQCEQNRQLTTTATAALAAAGIIEPWLISIGRGEGEEPLTIDGMHRINEEALNQLDAERLANLRASGALALAYAQLYSMAQMEQLTERAEYLAGANKKTQPEELDELFSNEDSGSINFDAFQPSTDDTGSKR